MTENRVVAVVSVSLYRDEEVLILKENIPTAKNKWNFPSGHIEYGEDILCAARREVKEETGFDVKLNGTTGVYNFISQTNDQVILFHFVGEIIGGELQLEKDIIIESNWVKVHDLLNFDHNKLREASVIKQITDNLLKKKVNAIHVFNAQLN